MWSLSQLLEARRRGWKKKHPNRARFLKSSTVSIWGWIILPVEGCPGYGWVLSSSTSPQMPPDMAKYSLGEKITTPAENHCSRDHGTQAAGDTEADINAWFQALNVFLEETHIPFWPCCGFRRKINSAVEQLPAIKCRPPWMLQESFLTETKRRCGNICFFWSLSLLLGMALNSIPCERTHWEDILFPHARKCSR